MYIHFKKNEFPLEHRCFVLVIILCLSRKIIILKTRFLNVITFSRFIIYYNILLSGDETK